MIGSVVGRVASLARTIVPDRMYVAVRPRVEEFLRLQEPELGYLLQKHRGRWGRRFVDVGANWGSYTVLLAPRFARVDAFEPIKRCAAALDSYARACGSDIAIHACALSDRNALVSFVIPKNDAVDQSGRARITETFDPAAVETAAKTLDSFAFDDVDFIKIDVEGHERSVIAGAAETIKRCRPTLLIEIEQRHSDESLVDRIAYVESFGYRASFLRNGEIRPAHELDLEHDQHIANIGTHGAYINNFLFEALTA